MTRNVLNEIQDHREYRTQEHPVDEIIFSALVSIWSGASSWDEITMFSSTKLDYLREFLPFKNGIPSQDTYNRLFSLLDDAGLEKALVSLSQWLISKNFTDLQSNADGTAMAEVLPTSDDMIHMLSACGSEFAISLRQLNVAAKSNEITAIPLLLQKLNITKTEVSSNALDAQTELAQLIHDKKGYYLLRSMTISQACLTRLKSYVATISLKTLLQKLTSRVTLAVSANVRYLRSTKKSLKQLKAGQG